MQRTFNNPRFEEQGSDKGVRTRIFDQQTSSKYPLSRQSVLMYQSTQENTDKKFNNLFQIQNPPQTRPFIQQGTSCGTQDQAVYSLEQSVQEASFQTPCVAGINNSRSSRHDSESCLKSEKSILQSQEYDKSFQNESSNNDILYESNTNKFRTIQENILEEAVQSSQKKQRRFNRQDNRNIVGEFDCSSNKINISNISSQSGSQRPQPLHSNSQYSTPLNNNNILQQFPLESAYQDKSQIIFPTTNQYNVAYISKPPIRQHNPDENLKEFECSLNKINFSNISNQRSSQRPPLQSNSQYSTPRNNNNIIQQFPFESAYQFNSQIVSPTVMIQQDVDQFSKPPIRQTKSSDRRRSNSSNSIKVIQNSRAQSPLLIVHSKPQSQIMESKDRLMQFMKDVHFLTSGVLFKKYGRGDRFFPSKRFIQLTPDLRHLILRNEAYSIKRMIPTHHILQIQMGRNTQNFKRFKKVYENNSRSCSLMLKEQTLDLEAENFQELDLFIKSLSSVLVIINDQGFLGVQFEQVI